MAPRVVSFPNVEKPLFVTTIAAGGMHSACLTSEGECYTWGSTEYGQLGLGEDIVKEKTCNEPQRVMMKEEGQDVPFLASSISLGGMHSAAIDKNDRLWCWGRADSGQTGQKEWIFSFFSGLVVPHLVTQIEEKVLMVSCGGFHTAAVTTNGKVYTMGKEDFGMLGTTVGSETTSDVNLVGSLVDKNIVGVSCGGWHTLMWSDEGELFACGKGEYGRLGLGHEASVCEPALVHIGENVKVKSASAGGSHSLILTKCGVYSTGRTGEGRLALNGVLSDRVLAPVEVELFHDHIIREGEAEFIQVSAGGSHSFIIKKGITPATYGT